MNNNNYNNGGQNYEVQPNYTNTIVSNNGNNTEEKKKCNLFKLFIIITAIYFVYNFLARFIVNLLPVHGKEDFLYSNNLISQSFMVILAFILLAVTDNLKVLREKKEKLYKGLLLGIPLLIINFLVLMASLSFINSVPFTGLITVVYLTLLIGISEELLFRGVILNEFLKRTDDTKKNVILAIIFSSVIFGLTHFGNIFGGKGVPETIVQVIQCFFAGLAYGAIYYKTKNIKVTILLHAIWDLSSLLLSIEYIWPSRVIESTVGLVDVFDIVLICLELFVFMNAMAEEKKKKKIAKIGIVISFLLIFFIKTEGTVNKVVFDYEFKELKNYRLVNTSKTTTNSMKVGKIIIFIELDGKKLTIKNNTTNQSIDFEYKVRNYTLIENEDSYILGINTTDKLYYKKIMKNEVTNDEKFLTDLVNSFEMIYIPDSTEIGYIEQNDTKEKYIYLNTYHPDKIIYLEGKEMKGLK